MSPKGPPLKAVASPEKKQSQSKWAIAALFLDNCGGSKAFAGGQPLSQPGTTNLMNMLPLL